MAVATMEWIVVETNIKVVGFRGMEFSLIKSGRTII